MQISYHPNSLYATHPFRTNKNVRTVFPHIFLKCSYGDIIGYGSMVLLPAYYENPKSIVSTIHAFDAYEKYFSDYKINEHNIIHVLDNLAKLYPEGAVVLEMAALDVLSQIKKQPLYKYLNIERKQLVTPMTIGLKPLEELGEDLENYKNWKSLKIKLGANLEENFERIDFIFNKYKGSIRIDVNGALSFDEACKLFEKLDKYPDGFIQYVEQPIAIKQYDNLKFLKNNFKTDIFADEDVTSIEDINSIYECVDGVNIKSYKGDGLCKLLDINHKARSLGLKTMIGCQLESILAVTALSHIAHAFDYCDLDGHLFFKEDYFSGLKVRDGICTLDEKPGIGSELIHTL
jgi:L-alanine-DL-glutamate epimerase-like enolase superfamily enzyme